MKYFLLRTPSDPKVIGVKNGIAQIEIVEKGFSNKEMLNRLKTFFNGLNYWKRNNFIPDSDFEIEYAKPLKNAKITDFLSFGPFFMACPFIINERVKEIFALFKLQEHYYIPVKLYEDEKIIGNLYLFYSPLMDYNIVDFKSSLFFTGTALSGKKIHSFKNFEEFNDFKHKNPLIKGEKIILNTAFDCNLDFFTPRFGEIYVSDKLKEAIKKENLTGINILETRDPIIETV